jgi:hypothetical protein
MRLNRFGLVFSAMLVAASLSSVASAQTSGTSVLKGTVLNSAGSPAASVTIRLYLEMGPQGSGGAVGKAVDFIPVPRLLMKGTLVKTVTTDAKGKFEAKNLKGGDYTYRAGEPLGVGYKFGRTYVEEGKTVEVEIKLDPPVKR